MSSGLCIFSVHNKSDLQTELQTEVKIQMKLLNVNLWQQYASTAVQHQTTP